MLTIIMTIVVVVVVSVTVAVAAPAAVIYLLAAKTIPAKWTPATGHLTMRVARQRRWPTVATCGPCISIN